MSENLSKNHLEIERKWLVKGWPDQHNKVPASASSVVSDRSSASLPLLKEELMRQGYISVEPTVRIREEKVTVSNSPDLPLSDNFILCFKSQGTLSRKEIEFPISTEHFVQLEDLIGLPLIPKVRRTYTLPDGLHLEVNHVDEGQPTEFWYAEVEFPTEKAAHAFLPETVGLGEYLDHEVTGIPGQSMGAYWTRTRLTSTSKANTLKTK